MSKRTQIVCLHEGKKGRSIDSFFIQKLMNELDPKWLRSHKWNNKIRTIEGHGRATLILKFLKELKAMKTTGSSTTLMVWADVDDNMKDCETLKMHFWKAAQAEKVSEKHFEKVVFAFAKDRLENWLEFLRTDSTNEEKEGPRIKKAEASKVAKEAAYRLATLCKSGTPVPNIPDSLKWSCQNWKNLVNRMQTL